MRRVFFFHPDLSIVAAVALRDSQHSAIARIAHRPKLRAVFISRRRIEHQLLSSGPCFQYVSCRCACTIASTESANFLFCSVAGVANWQTRRLRIANCALSLRIRMFHGPPQNPHKYRGSSPLSLILSRLAGCGSILHKPLHNIEEPSASNRPRFSCGLTRAQ